MSLRLKLTLLLALVAAVTVFFAWAILGRAVLAPFAREVMDTYLDQAVYVAEKVAEGEDPTALGRRLGLDIKLREDVERPGKLRRGCTDEFRQGHELVVCRGKRAPISVQTAAGWVTLRRELDPAAPRERIGPLLLVLLLGVVGASAYVAVVATRPLRATTQAMGRVAAGDLAHRLPESGGRELAEAARAFNAMGERVAAMLETERSLMAGISHELRTPLARLRLEVELLRDRGVPETRLTAMDKDLEEVDRLIGELLESSRLSLGERKLVDAPVSLEHVVHEALSRVELGDRQVELRGTAQPVRGDAERLVRAVANLIGNAKKHAPSGPIEITLADTSVLIADRGPGVPESSLSRLFEPFYRAPGGAASGLGLGLMIAKQVVELHGGTIAAKNREGGGLEVSLRLPAVRAG